MRGVCRTKLGELRHRNLGVLVGMIIRIRGQCLGKDNRELRSRVQFRVFG
jgi:hypothetical protein